MSQLQAISDEIKHMLIIFRNFSNKAPYKDSKLFSKAKTDNKIFVNTCNFFAKLKESR